MGFASRNGISQWENQVELVSSNRGGIFQIEVGCEKRKWDARKASGREKRKRKRKRKWERWGACVAGQKPLEVGWNTYGWP
jgi:hypothetical protein